MSDKRICKYCGMELSEDVPHGLRECHLRAVTRIAELSQAVGLITTLKPTMVMDANHPLDMVREVAEHVTARIAELEGLVDKLIEAGDALDSGLDNAWNILGDEEPLEEQKEWREIVKDRKGA